MSNDPQSRPSGIPWPPFLYVAAFGAALLLERVVPIDFAAPRWVALGALVLALAGLALDCWAMAALRRARTTLMPHRGASSLVVSGPYRLTRNPIYIGNLCFLVGLAILMRHPWLLATAVVAAVAIDRLAVRAEEAHLAARFGADWTAYAEAVPRWLGRARAIDQNARNAP